VCTHRKSLSLLAVSLLCVLAACHDDSGEADPVEAGIVDGCGHLKGGPDKAFTLAKDAASTPPDLTLKHHRHDLTFVDVPGGKGGVGTWKLADKADYVVLLSDDVALKVTGGDGKEVAKETSLVKPSGCAEAAVAHVYELTVGTYTFEFGPATATGVKLTLTEAVAGDDGH